MTRVLHVAAGNLFGGVETFLVTLARYQRRVPELYSEFAVCFEGRLANELRTASAVVHPLGEVRLRNPVSVLRANRAFRRVLKRNRYDAVITHGAWPHALVGPYVKLAGVKLVAWAHGAPLNPHLLDKIAHHIRPNLVIANSRHTALSMGPLFASVPSRVVYCPVELNPLTTRTREAIRAELETPENEVVIAFAARFERWKGHTLLLQAARKLLDRMPDGWSIWMCGGVQRPSEQPYADQLRAYVEGAGLSSRVHFLGARSDVPDVFRAADLFCQPNTGPEPFGIVFIEALSAGLPVVSTRMGGATEIVDETCGFLRHPDPEAIACALHELVSDADFRRCLAASAPARARLLCEPEARIRDIARAVSLLSS